MAAIPAALRAQDIPEDFVISLERRECHGLCPMYSVTIDAHGAVTYHGTMFVRLEGRVADRIPVSRVRALLSTIERIRFFDLRDGYIFVRSADGTHMTQTGLPAAIVTVTHNGRTKRVEDTLGGPDGLRELQRQIDRAARTQRWVRIDVATLQEMAQTGHLPSPEELGLLLRSALYADEVDVVQALLLMGADANRLPGDDHHGPTRPLLIARSAPAVRALITAGADVWTPDDPGQTAMMRAAELGPEVAVALLKAGTPVDMWIDREGETALVRAAALGNVAVVRLLLSAGANPAHRAPAGTALDVARRAQEFEQRRIVALPPELEVRPFVQDFDGVIAALEQALGMRRP